ncbi:hypothetical protein BDV18DRAFT_155960 [Aspergillus unguis]
MSLSYTPVGDTEGTEFTHTQITNDTSADATTDEHPQLVSKIEAWMSKPTASGGDARIVGLRISYHGGSRSGIFGESDGPKYCIELSKGERVTSLQFYGIVLSYSIFGFCIVTDRGRRVSIPPAGEGPSFVMERDVPVGSGLMVGIGGCVDDWTNDWDVVIGFGFYFLATPAFLHVDFEYLTRPEVGSIQPKRLDVVEGDNTDGTEQKELDISRTESMENTASTQEGWADGLGVNVTVSIGFCDIVEGPAYEHRGETMQATSYTVPHELNWTGKVTVPPNKHYIAELVYYEGRYTVEYKARIKYVTPIGEEVKWVETGTMDGVSRGAAVVHTRDITTQDKVKKMMGEQERQLTLRQTPPNTRAKHKSGKRKVSTERK